MLIFSVASLSTGLQFLILPVAFYYLCYLPLVLDVTKSLNSFLVMFISAIQHLSQRVWASDRPFETYSSVERQQKMIVFLAVMLKQ